MALFGAPIAHEDHALRACYAALAMQAAMQHMPTTYAAATVWHCVSGLVSTPEVVVRAIGNDLHMDYSAVGQTTHLAARMEQLAAPGSIAGGANPAAGGGFGAGQRLRTHSRWGLTQPVEVFELLGASAVRRRLQAGGAASPALSGATQRSRRCIRRSRGRAGHGQVVACVGEAGVGKSRLVYEVVHSHRIQGLVLESASVSYGKATPYFPVIDLLKRYAHVEDHDDTRTVRARVTGQVLTLDERLQDAIPALLALLEALPDDSPFRQLDPPQRRRHHRGAQASPAARKPGAAAAAGL